MEPTAPEPKPAPAATTKELGPIAKWAIGIGLSFLLGFLGARYGITPSPITIPAAAVQSQPQPIVIVVGSGTPAAQPVVTSK